MTRPVRIGTRGSPLALAQAHELRDRLAAAHAGLAPEIVTITTSGDRILDRTLAAAGGKGLFTKEIEEALALGHVDMAVHSMKDVPTLLPRGMVIPCLLPRADVRDAFFSPHAQSLMELPAGAVLGTASLRRQALALHLRPDLKVVVFRGNVQTRLAKLEKGEADATLLALAGLERLGIAGQAQSIIPTDQILPAPAQGAIGIEIREDDAEMASLLAPLHCPDTGDCVAAERGFLAALDGSCRTPIAALARLDAQGQIHLEGLVASPDGREVARTNRAGPRAGAAAMGRAAGAAIRADLAADFFTAT